MPLGAGGVLGEDVQDDRGAVDRRAAEDALEVVLLGRTQHVVEHHRVGVVLLGHIPDLERLPPPDIGGRVDAVPALHDTMHRVRTSGVGESGQLVEGLLRVDRRVRRRDDADQHDPLAERPVDEAAGLPAELAERPPVAGGAPVAGRVGHESPPVGAAGSGASTSAT